MSVAELLPAIRALPKAERVRLLHLLIDGVAADEPEAARLADLFPAGGTFDVHTPPDGYEAAAALQQLLAAAKEGR